jgi:hypothetical protein
MKGESMKAKSLMAMAVAALAAVPSFAVETYEVAWWTIDGGGSTGSGGIYSIAGSIGQVEGSRVRGGTFELNGGFWGIVGIPSPGAPPLRITQLSDRVVVSWPKSPSGWLLEQTAAFAPQVLWTTVSPSALQTNATDVYVVVSQPLDSRFYRLRKP